MHRQQTPFDFPVSANFVPTNTARGHLQSTGLVHAYMEQKMIELFLLSERKFLRRRPQRIKPRTTAYRLTKSLAEMA